MGYADFLPPAPDTNDMSEFNPVEVQPADVKRFHWDSSLRVTKLEIKITLICFRFG